MSANSQRRRKAVQPPSHCAIPTTYRGIAYRSRLEARWAAFFDRIGWHHTYEPFDGDGYIPDFVIHGDWPMLVEIKPAIVQSDYRAPIAKLTLGLERHWRDDVLIVGADPLPHWGAGVYEYPLAGVLGEHESHLGDDEHWNTWNVLDDPSVSGPWDFEPALWHSCGECRRIAVHHSTQTFAAAHADTTTATTISIHCPTPRFATTGPKRPTT
jgi:hypothetical protein